MPATYTSSLRLTKPANGDSNWGTTVNSGFTDLTDSAIAGYTTVSMPSNADYTLTSVNGAADEARSMMLNITSAVSLTTTRNIICPTASKLYFVKNATTGSQSIVFKTSGGSGITIPNGSTAALACNGTNVIAAFDWLSSISFSGTITGTFSGPLNGTVGATTPSTGDFTTLSASSTVSGTGFSTYLASPPAIGGTTPGAITGTTITANTQFSGPLNGTVGATTPSTGAFTTLSASSTVSGTGFSTYLASPPAIGGTTPSTGAFTTLSASSTVSGTGFSTYLASPPAIGGTTPSTGAFTTLSASSTVSGTGFSTYLASPPAIGGTAAAAGSFTTLNVSGVLTSGNLADTAGYKGIPQNSQTTSYTLALSDMGKHISITTGGITIPANGTVAFPVGSAVMIFNDSSSSQTIAITTDTLRQAGTANTGSRTLAQYGVATCLKVASTTWVISGAGVS